MTLRIVLVIGVCVILAVLESVIPFLFHLRAARPDLLLSVVLYLALHDDIMEGAALSAAAGYLSDLTSATPAFLYTFLAVLTFVVVRMAGSALRTEGGIQSAVVAFGASVIHSLVASLLFGFVVAVGFHVELPSLLWPNTAALILSSIAIELSRRAIRRNDVQSMKRWLAAGGVLGLSFLVGQLAAWRQLVRAGVYLPSTLQSSFFYILTGLHGLHLLGGIVALSLVLLMALKNRLSAFRHEPLKLCATYWHVMDLLWIYLFSLLLLS